jgi:hypothetical protein
MYCTGLLLRTVCYRWLAYIYKNDPFIKEVLRREIQGLKVWPVYRSQVFSITGTYFCFTPPVQSNNFKIQNPPVVGGRLAGWLICSCVTCAGRS